MAQYRVLNIPNIKWHLILAFDSSKSFCSSLYYRAQAQVSAQFQDAQLLFIIFGDDTTLSRNFFFIFIHMSDAK